MKGFLSWIYPSGRLQAALIPGCAALLPSSSGLSDVALTARGGPQAGGVSFISGSTCVLLALFLSAALACGRSEGQKDMSHDVLSVWMHADKNFLFYSSLAMFTPTQLYRPSAYHHRCRASWSNLHSFGQTFQFGGALLPGILL